VQNAAAVEAATSSLHKHMPQFISKVILPPRRKAEQGGGAVASSNMSKWSNRHVQRTQNRTLNTENRHALREK